MNRKLTMDELNRKSIRQFKESNKIPVTVILDNVRSMHNVGSVFRTADAFLVKKMVLCGYTPQPPHREIHKTALGATETVEWEYASSALETVILLKQSGCYIVAIEQVQGSVLLPGFELPAGKELAVIFGNEVEGVQQEIIVICDACIEIPQMGMKHSLNISVAAGIVLYKLAEKTLLNEKFQI